MSNLFQKLEIEAFRNGIKPRTDQSREWFRKKAATMTKSVIRPGALMKEEPLSIRNRTALGGMYMFLYDPKHKDTLPYYDTFPLVIVIGPAEGGFLGLNVHYLPPILRAKFLDALMDVTTNKRYDETTKFKITYDILRRASKYKYFKPCIKHYLTSQVRGKFAYVPAPEWEIAVFLPTAEFEKASKSTVYKDSRRKMNQ